jgi:hypothetical protein
MWFIHELCSISWLGEDGVMSLALLSAGVTVGHENTANIRCYYFNLDFPKNFRTPPAIRRLR